jgi:transposase
MGKRYLKERVTEILEKVRAGRRVLEVSSEYGIPESTIRTWLERETELGAGQSIEISRLRRENEALLRIVGQLTYESKMDKKNQRRVGS